MALADVLKMNDVMQPPTVGVGMAVVPTSFPGQLISPALSPVVSRDYGFAIVVSMTPFILVSESGNMRWETTVVPDNYTAVGPVRDEVMTICNTRLAS